MSQTASKTLKIDFVSDVVCPWCVVGLGGLEAALDRLKDEGVQADITFHPFELNPQMAPEGENIVEHIGRKYGASPEQSAANRAMIRERTMNGLAHARKAGKHIRGYQCAFHGNERSCREN